ncbi:tetratricopeptide repeat protein [Gracilimonas sp. Q87]|uniref:tetratricopeptide repeat protein n=1 Tax=Gracilimonas sp. Q87 TaxID=3384766 RepID=UPI003983EDE7
MKISNFTRLTGLLLVAGFFISCGSSKVNVDQLVADNKYDQALTEINNRLTEDPGQPGLYIKRAEITAEMAQDINPELRKDHYNRIVTDFELSAEMGANESHLATIDSLKQQYWKTEHNSGLRIFENNDGINVYETAKSHFLNALIIRPDAVSSYKNLAVAEFNLGNIDAAISSLESALDHSNEPSAELYENLGYLYLEKGNPAMAADYYEMANTDMTEDINLAYGLINAYISNSNHEAAASMLEILVEEYPDNANLRNVYGTQLYEITSNIMDDLKDAYEENDTSLAEQIKMEAVGMGEEAETQLIEAFKRDTTNIEYLESLAVFYNNLAANYLSIAKVAFEDHKSELRNRADKLINFATDYYGRLNEIHPNNSGYNSKLTTLNKLKNN